MKLSQTIRPPAHERRLPLLVALVVALAALLAFFWLAHLTQAPEVEALNEELLRWVALLRTPLLDELMLLFTRIGYPWVIAVLLVGLGLLLLWYRRWLDVVGVALAGGGAWLLTEALKNYYQRPRPAVVASPLQESSYSFPSAHALGSMVGYGVLLFIGLRVVRRHWLRWLLVLVLVAIIFGIGASRVYFGVHFLTDVLAGFLMGLAWLLICASLIWFLEPYRAYRLYD